ncbi:hypothetical protein ACWEDZ_09735 [Streptomyces sp. NPDC005047]
MGRYKLAYGWTCGTPQVDCECINRHAVWDRTKLANGRGRQLYSLQGQIDRGRRSANPQLGDLIFGDTHPNDGMHYGGDLDRTGIYFGQGRAIDANASCGAVKYDTVALGGTERDPLGPGLLSLTQDARGDKRFGQGEEPEPGDVVTVEEHLGVQVVQRHARHNAHARLRSPAAPPCRREGTGAGAGSARRTGPVDPGVSTLG